MVPNQHPCTYPDAQSTSDAHSEYSIAPASQTSTPESLLINLSNYHIGSDWTGGTH